MNVGTRPPGDSRQGEQWTIVELAEIASATEKSVSNWVSGRNTPQDLRGIQRAFFGHNQTNYRDERKQLRDARDLAKPRRGRRKSTREQPEQADTFELGNESSLTNSKTANTAGFLLSFEKIEEMCRPFASYDQRRLPDVTLGALAEQALRSRNRIEHLPFAVHSYRKLCKDLSNSVLDAPSVLKTASTIATRDLSILLDRAERNSEIALLDLKRVSSSSWSGFYSSSEVNNVRSINERIGRAINVSVSSAASAACAIIRRMQTLGVSLSVDTSPASAREQLIGMTIYSDTFPDFLIGADAPFALAIKDNKIPLKRRLDVHTEKQVMLMRRDDTSNLVSTLFLYPDSTALLQLKATYPFLRQNYGFNSNTVIAKIELPDFPIFAQKLEPGGAMFAWSPLYERLSAKYRLAPQHSTEFNHSISLYLREDWDVGELASNSEAFVNLFIALWNDAVRNPLKYWLLLISRPDFMSEFGGSIVGIKE